jgi:hypothetical protein
MPSAELRPGDPAGILDPDMTSCAANADILTSAYMAAGMTSRARRPETSTPAG